MAGGITSVMTQFDRVLGQPLETNSVFGSYDAARNYAANNAQAYAGQIIRVLGQGGVTVYVIEENKTLTRLGAYYGEFVASTSPMIIVHNLGRCPEVIFVDDEGTRYEVEVSYPNLNQVKITWNDPGIIGKIYII
jgi:hypothetical protein